MKPLFRPLGWHYKCLAMRQAVVSSRGGRVSPGGGGGLWQAGDPDRDHPWAKGGSLFMRQSWRWAKAAAESGRAQPHAQRALTAPTHSAGLLHFHPLIRYIYFSGISLTRIDCTIIAYFFGPLAVNLEARRAEAGRPSLSGLTPARAVGCHDNRDRCHPCRPRPPDGENRSCDGAAAHSHRPAKCSRLNHLFHLARRGKHKRNEMNLTSVF